MTALIFWVCVGAVFYSYIGYPMFILLVSVLVRRRVLKGDYEPEVSVLIAAYNEEKDIRRKLENTLSLDYPKEKLQILVVSDGSTDRTDDVVREFAGRGVELFRVEGRVGKTEARNRAVGAARGEIIAFSDATTLYDSRALRNMVRNFCDPRVGAVSGRYDYVTSQGASIGLANVLFWRYENFIKTRQSMIRTLTGMSGCINSFRKKLYEPLPGEIIEDLVEPLKMVEKGFRIVFEPEAKAFEVTTDSARQEFKMRIRVISQGMRGILSVRNLLNPLKYPVVAFQLFSHKVLRWLVPFLLIGAFISNVLLLDEGTLYVISIIGQISFYFLAAIGFLLEKFKKRFKLLGFPLYFCTLNLASLVAFFKVIFGGKISKWETAR